MQGGSRIAFSSTRAGGRDLFWIPSDGSSSEPELLLKNPHAKWASAWSHQTKELLFDQIHAETKTDILAVSIDGDREPRVVVQTKGVDGLSTISHDGRGLAYVSTVTDSWEAWVRPYHGPGAPTRISPNGGMEPVWGPGDRELFYREGNRMMAANVSSGPEFRFRAPEMLFESEYLHDRRIPSYDVGPDGRFLMIKPLTGEGAARRELIVVLNWFEELKRLVPTE